MKLLKIGTNLFININQIVAVSYSQSDMCWTISCSNGADYHFHDDSPFIIELCKELKIEKE